MLLPLALGLALAATSGPATTAFLGAGPGDQLKVAAAVELALVGNGAIAVQSREATGRFMETARGIGVDCDPALDQCLLELAGICTVDQAVFGLVEGDRLTLRLAVVKGAVVRTATATLDARPDVFNAELREAIGELVAPAAVAALVVDAPSGSLVSLDGLERGRAPLLSAINGVAPGQHFVDVQFPDGAITTKTVVLSAGQRTRVIAVPRPLGADVIAWTGWGSLGVSALSAGIATLNAGVYFYSRAGLENFSTHYASPDGEGATIDYNENAARTEAIKNHDLLTDLPTYGYPLFATAGISAAVGGALLFVGYRWSDLFEPPTEERER